MGRLSSKEHRRQDAVLWTFLAPDKFGRQTVSAPVPLKVRWVEEVRENVGPENSVVTTNITVTVDREIPLGSLMWKGKKRNLPEDVDDLYEVVFREEIPNVKANDFRRRVFLVRYSDALPTVG